MTHPNTIDTAHQVVRIKLRRGTLKIGPGQQIDGLWDLVRRETAANEQIRRMCGGITRQTLLRWRDKEGFPEPVLRVPARGVNVELWSKTDVESWLRRRRAAQRTRTM